MISMKLVRDKAKNESQHGRRLQGWIKQFDASTASCVDSETETQSFYHWLFTNVISQVSTGSQRSYLTSLRKITECNVLMSEISALTKVSKHRTVKKRPKSKSLSWQEYAVLESYLLNKSLQNHDEVSDWLRSTIHAGLRPAEWATAHIYVNPDGSCSLKVRNTVKAELTPTGDAYQLPQFRVIPLTNLDRSDIACIRRHVEMSQLKSALNQFDEWYNKVRLKLYNVSKQCFPDLPTINLYSGRHQFCANLKSAGYEPRTIMLLMGHSNEKTARHSYGAKKNGTHQGIDTSATVKQISDFQSAFMDSED